MWMIWGTIAPRKFPRSPNLPRYSSAGGLQLSLGFRIKIGLDFGLGVKPGFGFSLGVKLGGGDFF
jgi:hypothetical protein